MGIKKGDKRYKTKKLHGLFGYEIPFHKLDHCFRTIPSLDVLRVHSANL